jgi:hypothetical protein
MAAARPHPMCRWRGEEGRRLGALPHICGSNLGVRKERGSLGMARHRGLTRMEGDDGRLDTRSPASACGL